MLESLSPNFPIEDISYEPSSLLVEVNEVDDDEIVQVKKLIMMNEPSMIEEEEDGLDVSPEMPDTTVSKPSIDEPV